MKFRFIIIHNVILTEDALTEDALFEISSNLGE